VTRDPRAVEGEVLVQIARAFPKVSNDDFDEAVSHMLRMLRTYVALDEAGARVTPRAEVMPTTVMPKCVVTTVHDVRASYLGRRRNDERCRASAPARPALNGRGRYE
jgi:hypothetical protein